MTVPECRSSDSMQLTSPWLIDLIFLSNNSILRLCMIYLPPQNGNPLRKGTLSWSTLYLNTKNPWCLFTDTCLLEEASPICPHPLQPLHPWSSWSTDLAQTPHFWNSMFFSCHASQGHCRCLRCLFDSFSHPHSLPTQYLTQGPCTNTDAQKTSSI